jgi:hypothetical protein
LSRLSLAVILAVLLFSCQALAQTSPIAPNGIEYVGDADTFSSGQTYNISFSIFYNGAPLKSEGVRIYILSSDTSIIPAELGTYELTDKNGVATYTIAAGKTGDVTLTATAMNVNSGVSVDRKLHIIQGSVATPTATPSPTALATQTPTTVPTISPTSNPTIMPTVNPSAAATGIPAPSGSAEQAFGIIVAGIALAVVLLAAVIIAKTMGKK